MNWARYVPTKLEYIAINCALRNVRNQSSNQNSVYPLFPVKLTKFSPKLRSSNLPKRLSIPDELIVDIIDVEWVVLTIWQLENSNGQKATEQHPSALSLCSYTLLTFVRLLPPWLAPLSVTFTDRHWILLTFTSKAFKCAIVTLSRWP